MVWRRIWVQNKVVRVETRGCLLAGAVAPAETAEQAGARRGLSGRKPWQPRLECIWAEGSSSGEPLAPWWATDGAW